MERETETILILIAIGLYLLATFSAVTGYVEMYDLAFEICMKGTYYTHSVAHCEHNAFMWAAPFFIVLFVLIVPILIVILISLLDGLIKLVKNKLGDKK